jgi:hypothetical protein
MDEFPPRPTAAQEAELKRRLRGRNLALIWSLAVLAALFFAISIVKLARA